MFEKIISCEKDDWYQPRIRICFESPAYFKTVHVRHVNIKYDEIGWVLCSFVQGVLTFVSGCNLIAGTLKDDLDHLEQTVIIIDYQY